MWQKDILGGGSISKTQWWLNQQVGMGRAQTQASVSPQGLLHPCRPEACWKCRLSGPIAEEITVCTDESCAEGVKGQVTRKGSFWSDPREKYRTYGLDGARQRVSPALSSAPLHHFSAMGPLAKFVVIVVESLSRLFVTSWTVTRQAPTSVGFPRQEYWSGLPFPSPGDLPDPRIKPMTPALAGRFFTTEPPGKLSAKLLKKFF